MHRYLLALPLLFVPLAHAQQRNGAEVYRVTETGGGLGVFVNQTVIFLRAGGGNTPMRWVVERVRQDRNWCGKHAKGKCVQLDERRHDWIDGDTCPQLIGMLRELSKIPLPAFSDPDDAGGWSVSDTTLLTVQGRPVVPATEKGNWPKELAETISVSEYTGPYQSWWHKGQEALAGCWKAEAPLAGGKPIAPSLPDIR